MTDQPQGWDPNTPPPPAGGTPPGGYPPPPPGGYPPPPPGGYPPAGYGGVQPLSQSDERLWAMLSHLGGIFFGFIPSLVIMLTLGKRSAFVKDQSTEALNFQISYTIAMVISIILIIVIIGILLIIVIGIGGLVLMIMASIKSYNGELYRYPINIRMVK